MGGIFHFFDFSRSSASREFLGNNDGFEAPRNSLELEFPVEASQGCHLVHEDIPYSCQLKHSSLKINNNQSETPVKELIDTELSSRSCNQHNVPGVVARLMGVDMLPSKVEPAIHGQEFKNYGSRNKLPRKEPSEIASKHHSSLSSTPLKQTKKELLPYVINQDSSRYTREPRSTKPQSREHPQEELLQKFKKDFEAWQASRPWEHSSTLDLDRNIRHMRDNKIIAQENLNKEKLLRYGDSMRNYVHDSEPRYYVSTTKPSITTPKEVVEKEIYVSRLGQFVSQNDIPLRNSERTTFLHSSVAGFDRKQDRSSSPTRIVILKPSSEGTSEGEDSFTGSSTILKRGSSIEDFLEEVKERLRCEIQGKASAREKEMENSFKERSTGQKQMEHNIAKQIRGCVSRDLGTTLVKSKSTRSYGSEVQFNEPNSPEFINRGTRKLLTERLKNVLKIDKKLENPLVNDARSRTSLLMREGEILSPKYDYSEMGKKVNYKDDKKDFTESKPSSFRRERQSAFSFDAEASSPRNLVRSYSAPVSGTPFGKLLLADQHVLTGAQICRKHEASELDSAEMGKNRKDGSKLKDKVSSLRHNFNLKGKLFKKKTHMMPDLPSNEFDHFKSIVTTPSVHLNFGYAQDNYTEVPPSPASVCSSPLNELSKPGHPSPDSPLDAPFTEDQPSPQISGEFALSFPEPELPEKSESGGLKVTSVPEPHDDEVAVVEGSPEAYVREILITAGLFEAQVFDRSFSSLDALTKPISKWVFEKVEESYYKYRNVEEQSEACFGEIDLNRRMLFDLINEALPVVLRPSSRSSAFNKWILSPDTMPHGRQLLCDLMVQIRLIYADTQVDQSVDSLVSWYMKSSPWPCISNEDIKVMGREIECVVLRELIGELVLDVCS